MKTFLRKKLLPALLSLAMIMTIMPAFTITAFAEFGGGSGTSNDPFLIESLSDLKRIRSNYTSDWRGERNPSKGKYFKLMNNIDIASEPNFFIGGTNNFFQGSFDGNNKTVYNYSYSLETNNDYLGFFGNIYGGSIKNLTISCRTGAQFKGNNNIGILAGSAEDTAITNCHVKVGGNNVLRGNAYVGGLVGAAKSDYQSITDCTSEIDIIGNSTVGGLIGWKGNSPFTDCSATGSVQADSTGDAYAGGLAGWAGNCEVMTCFATGAVYSKGNYTGGLFGFKGGNYIWNCNATGNVTGNSGAYTGGLIGINSGGVVDCYASGTVFSQNNYTGGLIGANTDRSDEIIRSEGRGKVTGTNYVGGLIGETKTFYIGSCSALNDVTASGLYAGGLVGSQKSGHISNGSAKGTVSGIKFVGGLVGEQAGLVENSNATGNVTGQETLGGLTGITLGGNIQKSYATGNVTGTNSQSPYIGGLIGATHGGTVKNSYATGNVKGYDFVGGFLGVQNTSAIEDSYATGNVEGTNYYIGGFIGAQSWNMDGDRFVTRCYSTGDVTGDAYVGGLIGAVIQRGRVIDSYSISKVTARDYVGGLIGYQKLQDGAPGAERVPIVKNSFFGGTVTGINNPGSRIGAFYGCVRLGGAEGCYYDQSLVAQNACGENTTVGTVSVTGKTTAEMEEKATYAGWDLSEVWSMFANAASGYPYLINIGNHVLVTPQGGAGQTAPESISWTASRLYNLDEPLSGKLQYTPVIAGPGVYHYSLGTLSNKAYQLRLKSDVTYTVTQLSSTLSYEISNNQYIYNGAQRPVTVTAKEAGQTVDVGTIMPYYMGINGTNYNESTQPPTNAGTYRITKLVIEGKGIYAPDTVTTGIINDSLIINKADVKTTVTGISPSPGTYGKSFTVTVKSEVVAPGGGSLAGGSVLIYYAPHFDMWSYGINAEGIITGTIKEYYYTTFDYHAGNYQITAFYGGNENYNPSPHSLPFPFTLNKTTGAEVNTPTLVEKTASSVKVTATLKSSGTGQTVEYAINTTNIAPSDGWQDSGEFTGLNEYTRYYFFARAKESTDYLAGAVSASLAVQTADITPPTAEVQYKSNGFKSFLNTATFGLFFKKDLDVTVQPADTGSGVKKTEYYKASSAVADPATITGWSVGTSFSVTQNEKFILYVKVTDNENNTKIYHEGVVVYTDSAADTASISYTKTSNQDKTALVTLNGNTVAGVKNGGASLIKDTDFTVSGNTITFKAGYLENLTAGTYTLKVSYVPLGLPYVAADGNEAPTDTQITLTVSKAEQTLTLIGAGSSYTYGDAAFDLSLSGNLSSGNTTYEIVNGTGVASISGNRVTILKAGTFNIKATVAANEKYTEASVTGDLITVSAATPTVTLTGANVTYGTQVTLTATVSKPTGSTGATPDGTVTFKEGDTVLATDLPLSGGKASYTTTTAPGAGNHTYTAIYSGQSGYYSQANGTHSVGVGLSNQAALNITGKPDTVTYGDNGFTLSTGSSGSGTGTVIFSVPNETVLSITPSGVVTINGAGTVTVTAVKAGDSNYNAATATLNITVAKRNISNVTVNVTGTTVYTGTGLQPTFTVSDGSIAINTGDYTNSYGANINAGINSGSITLTGQRNYTGTKTVNFNIVKANQTLSRVGGNTVDKQFGDSDFSLGITGAVAGTTTTYTGFDTNVITVDTSGNVHIVGPGTTTVKVDNPGNENYNAATQLSITVNVTAIDAPDVPVITVKKINDTIFRRVLNFITFGIFYKEGFEVTITAGDGTGSDIKSISYSINGGKTYTSVDTITDEIRFSVFTNFEGVIKAYATDNANNNSEIAESGKIVNRTFYIFDFLQHSIRWLISFFVSLVLSFVR